MEISKILTALITVFFAAGAFAGDLEDRAVNSGLSFIRRGAAIDEVRDAGSYPVPAPVKLNEQDPYYPGTNEREPEVSGPVHNFGRVIDGVYRGARITNEKQFKFIEDAGISTLVNIQWPARDNPGLCKKYGFDCSYQPVKIVPGADLYFGMKDLKSAFDLTLDELKAGRKVYIHCHFGRERTGILAAALMIRQNMCDPARRKDPRIKEKTWELVDAGFKKFGYKMTYESVAQTF